MLGHFSADIIYSKKWPVFSKHSSRKTVSFEEQIMSKDKYPWIIGPLQDSVTWYGINYAGTQMTQWDFQNKGKSGWPGKNSFVLEVPLRHLRPSVIYSVPCDRILQRVYFSAKWRLLCLLSFKSFEQHTVLKIGEYLLNKPLQAAGMSADNVRGWEIVRKMNIWPRSEASRANVRFWGQSLSERHYQPTY